jgi:hypothetical protein
VPTWSDTRFSLFTNAVNPKLTQSVSKPSSPVPVPLDPPTLPSFPTLTISTTNSRTITSLTCHRTTANSSSQVHRYTEVVRDHVLLHHLCLVDRPHPLSPLLPTPQLRHLHTRIRHLLLPSPRPLDQLLLRQLPAPPSPPPPLVGRDRPIPEVSHRPSESDLSSITQALLRPPQHLPQLPVVTDKATALPWWVFRECCLLTIRTSAKTKPTSCRTHKSL